MQSGKADSIVTVRQVPVVVTKHEYSVVAGGFANRAGGLSAAQGEGRTPGPQAHGEGSVVSWAHGEASSVSLAHGEASSVSLDHGEASDVSWAQGEASSIAGAQGEGEVELRLSSGL